MGVLSGLTTGIYRQTRDGRRVFARTLFPGLPKVWYLIDDTGLARFELRLRRFYTLTIFVLIPLVVVSSPDGYLLWVPFALLWPPVAMRYWVVRDLQRTDVTQLDLLPIDRRTRDLSQIQAVGAPTLWLGLVAAMLMAALSVFVWATDGVWWAVLGLIMFGVLAVSMARAISAIRRARS